MPDQSPRPLWLRALGLLPPELAHWLSIRALRGEGRAA
jgi:hypothetical protein